MMIEMEKFIHIWFDSIKTKQKSFMAEIDIYFLMDVFVTARQEQTVYHRFPFEDIIYIYRQS